MTKRQGSTNARSGGFKRVMKAILLNGSPRKNWNTHKLLDLLKQGYAGTFKTYAGAIENAAKMISMSLAADYAESECNSYPNNRPYRETHVYL